MERAPIPFVRVVEGEGISTDICGPHNIRGRGETENARATLNVNGQTFKIDLLNERKEGESRYFFVHSLQACVKVNNMGTIDETFSCEVSNLA